MNTGIESLSDFTQPKGREPAPPCPTALVGADASHAWAAGWEAALATQPKDGELLALADELCGKPPHKRFRWEIGEQLRTLASRLVVTDAMRKRTREWLLENHGYWDDDYVERLLAAALQPDSGEG